jgi:hypothetical protein
MADTTGTPNPLNTTTVARTFLHILPYDVEADGTKKYSVQNRHELLSLFIHALMLSLGFRLEGLKEDDKLESIDESFLWLVKINLIDFFKPNMLRALHHYREISAKAASFLSVMHIRSQASSFW